MKDHDEFHESRSTGLFRAPPPAEQDRMVEAMLFASPSPLTTDELDARLPHGCSSSEALERLRKRHEGRGVSLVSSGAGWAFRTAPDLAFLMQREVVEARPLSRAAIETLAIIAYHQPATRAEIEEIRGVAVSRGTLDLLIEKDWVRLGRRRMTPGRPATFMVTEAFLDHFNLASAKDLPGLKELRDAGLLDRTPPGEAGPVGMDDDADQPAMFASEED
ncbi:MAG: SMC-Scp complex subunit ScpB [Pseudomonadota bacterium]